MSRGFIGVMIGVGEIDQVYNECILYYSEAIIAHLIIIPQRLASLTNQAHLKPAQSSPITVSASEPDQATTSLFFSFSLSFFPQSFFFCISPANTPFNGFFPLNLNHVLRYTTAKLNTTNPMKIPKSRQICE
jgi:hypothetical protein